MASLPPWQVETWQNRTINSSASDLEELLSLKYKIDVPMIVFCALCYIVIFLLCIWFNGLLCWLIRKTPEAHKSTDYFILNLAISDLLVGIFCIPFTLINHIYTENQLGDVMCKMTPLIQGTAVGSSVFTLAAIALDRYQMLFKAASESRFTGRQVAVTVCAIWVASTAIMLPNGLFRHETSFFIDPLQRSINLCVEDWPLMHIYTLLLFVICYLVPLIITGGLYVTICIHLWYKRPSGEDEAARQKTQKMKQVIKMLIMIEVMFALSWLPLYVCWILYDFGPLTVGQRVTMMSYVEPIAHLLAFSNSCVNPVVYGYFRPQIRREAWQTMPLRCVSCTEQQMSPPVQEQEPVPVPLQPRQHAKLQRLQYA